MLSVLIELKPGSLSQRMPINLKYTFTNIPKRVLEKEKKRKKVFFRKEDI